MREKINISSVLAGQRLDITEVDKGIRLLNSMHYDFGYIDLEQRALQTIDSPLSMRFVTHVLGTLCCPSTGRA